MREREGGREVVLELRRAVVDGEMKAVVILFIGDSHYVELLCM